MLDIKWKPTDRDLRTFAFGLFPFALLIGWLRWVRSGSPTLLLILGGIGAALSLIGLMSPQRLRWLYVVWMVAVAPIGWVVSHLVLAVVYFGLVTPIGWIRRVTGSRDLELSKNPRVSASDDSYWEPVEQNDRPERYFRQF